MGVHSLLLAAAAARANHRIVLVAQPVRGRACCPGTEGMTMLTVAALAGYGSLWGQPPRARRQQQLELVLTYDEQARVTTEQGFVYVNVMKREHHNNAMVVVVNEAAGLVLELKAAAHETCGALAEQMQRALDEHVEWPDVFPLYYGRQSVGQQPLTSSHALVLNIYADSRAGIEDLVLAIETLIRRAYTLARPVWTSKYALEMARMRAFVQVKAMSHDAIADESSNSENGAPITDHEMVDVNDDDYLTATQ